MFNQFRVNPYVVGGFMREDVFSVQFSVYVKLDIGLLDNDGVSTYTVSANHFVGGTSTVTEAVELVNQFFEQYSEDDALDEVASKYICPEEDCLEWSSAGCIRICDRDDRLIMGGKPTGTKVSWVKPVTTLSEIAEVRAEMDALLSEASFEAGWDNFSTARRMRRQAAEIGLKLSSSPIVLTPHFAQELTRMNILSL